jgi:hypothetical protein
LACKRILKNVYGTDLKFDDAIFEWAFKIITFDKIGSAKQIDRYELTSLL